MITVHHTADSNTSDREDAEIVRSTYYYHAVVRGWGDIGYNYIIGQRGKIYEGRAGGDYSVAAHAVWNNRSSVGVSMIGNFEEFNVNAGQLAGLKSIVRALAGHYGIDLSASMSTHKECLSGQDCLMHDYTSTRLTGHRDIGYTTCPGKDLYKYVEQMRSEIDFSSGFTLVSNPDIREVAVASSSSPVASQTPTPTKPLAATNVGPDIRLKLSYPKDDILLSAYMPDEALVVSYGKKSGKLPKGRTYSITVSK
ncbi:MAG TPA: peptidoglycan recognition family protein [bacterium]|nr:peptidoglycan recognition family protein [bacterium]